MDIDASVPFNKSTQPQDGSTRPQIIPDSDTTGTYISKDAFQTYFRVVFSQCSGLIPCRILPEKGVTYTKAHSQAYWIRYDDNVVNHAAGFARIANKYKMAFCVIPGTVEKQQQAKSADIIQMQTLLIDIDSGNTEEKLGKLSKYLAKPSLVVESGGITTEGSKKLHIYWQLSKAATGEEIQKLMKLRYDIALAGGGDTHFRSAHQPIRVPGSIYWKDGACRSVTIRSHEDMEYTLEELAAGTEKLSCSANSVILPMVGSSSPITGTTITGTDIKGIPDTNTAASDTTPIEHPEIQNPDSKTAWEATVTPGGNSIFNNASINSAVKNSFLTLDAIASQRTPIEQILTEEIHAGGEGERTRFRSIGRVSGYLLYLCHEGLISFDDAVNAIHGYNLLKVVPSWPEGKLTNTINSLWKNHIAKYGEPKKRKKPSQEELINILNCPVSSGHHILTSPDVVPDNLIDPFVLNKGGILAIGGMPKVGKSSFLLTWLTRLCAGRAFLELKAPRPLKIFYLQAEIGLYYLQKRLQLMNLPPEVSEATKTNLFITYNTKLRLNSDDIVSSLARHINNTVPEPDIIAIDPLRSFFDGGREGASENDNNAMMFFLQNRVEALLNMVNPQAGVIIVHHLGKITRALFNEDPFQSFCGASSLRGHYTSGMILCDTTGKNRNPNERTLRFEFRHGEYTPPKTLLFKPWQWIDVNNPETDEQRELIQQSGIKATGLPQTAIRTATQHDAQREKKAESIIRILEEEAQKGRFYLMNQFSGKFQNHKDLGGTRAIYDCCSAAAARGDIKFFCNPEKYSARLEPVARASFGYMCTENMKIKAKDSDGNPAGNYIRVLPTHYKRDGDGHGYKTPVPDQTIWHVDNIPQPTGAKPQNNHENHHKENEPENSREEAVNNEEENKKTLP